VIQAHCALLRQERIEGLQRMLGNVRLDVDTVRSRRRRAAKRRRRPSA
jgi:hypothetical protein